MAWRAGRWYRHDEPGLTQQTPHRIAAGSARREPRRAEAMQGGPRLVHLRLHRHRTEAFVPEPRRDDGR